MIKHSENTEPSNSTKPVLSDDFLFKYLPFGLKAVMVIDAREDFSFLEIDNYYIFDKGNIWQYCGYADKDLYIPLGDGDFDGFILRNENTYADVKSFCKPILKPISDLSILVIEEFEKYDGKINGKANDEIINLFCEENGVDEIIENIVLSSLPYECVEYIFKNHYDFFGLIEKGLAVSIHDVEQVIA